MKSEEKEKLQEVICPFISYGENRVTLTQRLPKVAIGMYDVSKFYDMYCAFLLQCIHTLYPHAYEVDRVRMTWVHHYELGSQREELIITFCLNENEEVQS